MHRSVSLCHYELRHVSSIEMDFRRQKSLELQLYSWYMHRTAESTKQRSHPAWHVQWLNGNGSVCVCVCVQFVRNMVFIISKRNYYHLFFFFFRLKIEHPTRESHRDPFFMVVVDVVVVASAVSGSFLSSGGSGLLTLGEQNNGQRIQKKINGALMIFEYL